MWCHVEALITVNKATSLFQAAFHINVILNTKCATVSGLSVNIHYKKNTYFAHTH